MKERRSWVTSGSVIIPADFHGTIQCDGYSAYDCFQRMRGATALAGCWAHLRRGLVEKLLPQTHRNVWRLL
ncbi:IS66 family transposase [Verrucomicrobiota bacterium sgz303538]